MASVCSVLDRLRLVPQALVEDAGLRLRIRAAQGESLEPADETELGSEATGPLSEVRDVAVALRQEHPTRWERIKDWWNSPVEIG